MKILVIVPTPSDFDERLRRLLPNAEVVHAGPDLSAYDDALQTAEIIVGSPPVDDLPRAGNLQWLQLPSAGANTYVGRISEAIHLTTANGVYGIPVSEHAFALMLSLARSIQKYVRDQTQGRWDREGTFLELFGSTCGVLGLGDIGLAVAARAKAFGMRVVGIRRNPDRPTEGIDRVYGPDAFEEMLSACDFVVNILPETDATLTLLDRGMIRAMKRGSLLVNVGRGSTIDEAALVQALQDGHLAGAGLDVFEEEPLPPNSPLWEMPNVIITPHIGGSSPRGDDRIADLFLDNFRRYVDSEPLQNLVDHEIGY